MHVTYEKGEDKRENKKRERKSRNLRVATFSNSGTEKKTRRIDNHLLSRLFFTVQLTATGLGHCEELRAICRTRPLFNVEEMHCLHKREMLAHILIVSSVSKCCGFNFV